MAAAAACIAASVLSSSVSVEPRPRLILLLLPLLLLLLVVLVGQTRDDGAQSAVRDIIRLTRGIYKIKVAHTRLPELIPVLGSQPVGDVSHEADGRLPLLSARPAVILATRKRTAANFAAR